MKRVDFGISARRSILKMSLGDYKCIENFRLETLIRQGGGLWMNNYSFPRLYVINKLPMKTTSFNFRDIMDDRL